MNHQHANRLEIIAHRGFSAIAPEDTLAAFSAAIEHQASSIEFDVQLSSDGVPVIIHDATVDRTTNGTGNVRDKTIEQLKVLDAGSWFSPQFSQERIPTLREALDAIAVPFFIYLDVKQSHHWSAADVDGLVQTLRQAGWEDKCIVACFNDGLLERVREQSNRITLGYLVDSLSVYTAQIAKAAADGNAIIMSEYHVLLDNPTLVQDSSSQGVDVVAWTVDSEDDLQKLANMGVVRIVSNSLVGYKDSSRL